MKEQSQPTLSFFDYLKSEVIWLKLLVGMEQYMQNIVDVVSFNWTAELFTVAKWNTDKTDTSRLLEVHIRLGITNKTELFGRYQVTIDFRSYCLHRCRNLAKYSPVHRLCNCCNCSNSTAVCFSFYFPCDLLLFFVCSFGIGLQWCGAFARHIEHAFVRHHYNMACAWLCFRSVSISLFLFHISVCCCRGCSELEHEVSVWNRISAYAKTRNVLPAEPQRRRTIFTNIH